MPIRWFTGPGAFGPEMIAKMAAALDAAFKQLQGTGEPDVVRERIANRIIAAARLGERDPTRLLEAALRNLAFSPTTMTAHASTAGLCDRAIVRRKNVSEYRPNGTLTAILASVV